MIDSLKRKFWLIVLTIRHPIIVIKLWATTFATYDAYVYATGDRSLMKCFYHVFYIWTHPKPELDGN